MRDRCLVPLLRKWKAGQSIREDGPTWHMSKQGTPTMGGLMFILGIGVAIVTVWAGEEIQRGNFSYLFVYLFALVFGAIGFVDDYSKAAASTPTTGLTALQKFLLQLAAAVAFTVLLRNYGYLTPSLYIPFFNVELAMPWVVYMVFAAFVMVGYRQRSEPDGRHRRAGHRGHHRPCALFYRGGVCLVQPQRPDGGVLPAPGGRPVRLSDL